MSIKAKLFLIISFFLIVILLICIVGYKIISVKKTSEVLAQTTNMESQISENKNKDEEDAIVVILNDNKKQLEENIEKVDEQENKAEENNETIAETSNNRIEETENQPVQNTDSFYIKVNYGANVVTVYTKDLNGNYTMPYKAFTCSTGTATPTSGTYNTDYKYRWLGLFGNVYGQYCTRVVGNILFHSVPYLEKGNPASLEYWEYDKLRNFCFCRLYKINSGRC